ncbi:kinetochore-associated protein NSL1 homolog [Podarcis raffonei]|uniref:kinetochore-associated protein NSL1 homolog n=1 Tax=Podarcis raffonei TaxID=65483 RepID=UPI0023294F08|nr:kinetochore-associated protein NSL1 homolog [Podarcis raffonei]
MEEAPPPAAAAAASPRDCRVRCCSRRQTAELLDYCQPFVRKLGEGQPVEAESLEQAVVEAIWNFETAVQENITVNGLPWQESSDDPQNDTDIKLLEDQLDELIVEVASKRNQYPRKIQVHVVQALKRKQELLGCYRPLANHQEIKAEPSQDSRMADLRLSTKTASRDIGESFKSLSSLVEKAEGFSKALSMQPTLGLCKLHQEICSGSEVKKADNIEVKDLLSQVEVTPPESGTSNSILLKKKRRSYSPQKHYPLRAGVINLDT